MLDGEDFLEAQQTSEAEELIRCDEGIDLCLAYSSDGQLLLGQSLQNFSRKFGGIELDIQRDPSPMHIVDFGGPEFGRAESEEAEDDFATSLETQ